MIRLNCLALVLGLGISMSANAFAGFERILNLQVGSKTFTVAREVLLRKESVLRGMFADSQFDVVSNDRLPNGSYYFDADEEAFSHVLEFLRQDTITIKDSSIMPQLERLYKLADYLSFTELKGYVAQKIWSNTPKDNWDTFSYEIWKNIPEIPLRKVTRLGYSPTYPFFIMNQDQLLIGTAGFSDEGLTAEMIELRKGNLIISRNVTSYMPYNTLTGIEIGVRSNQVDHLFSAFPLLDSQRGTYMCSIAGSTSVFAIFHILTGKQSFKETYTNIADCVRDICSLYGWCEDAVHQF